VQRNGRGAVRVITPSDHANHSAAASATQDRLSSFVHS